MTHENTKESLISARVLRGTAANIVGQVVMMGTGFVITPFILHQVGPSSYGLWALVGSMVAYGTLLDLGMTPAVSKYVAEFRALQQTEEAHKLIATALTMYVALGLVAVGLGVAIAPFFPDLFGIAEADQSTASWLVVLASIGAGLSLPCSTAISVLRGLHRYDLINVISVIGTLLVAAGTVAVLLLGYGIVGMVAVNIPVMLLTQVIGVSFIRRLAPELRFGWRGANMKNAREIFAFSSSVSAQQLAKRFQTKTDQIVIGAYMPVSAVTPYALALRLGTISLSLTRQFMKVLLPLASELHAEADYHRLRALYVTSTRLAMAIFIPIGGAIVLLAGPLLDVWVGREYASYAYLVAILTIAGFIEAISWPAGPVLQGMARHKILAFTSIGVGVANLALSMLLVQRFGLAGVAFGTLIPTVVGVVVVMPYMMKLMEIRLSQAITQMFVPALLPAAPAMLALYALREIIEPSSFIAIGFVAGVGALVYGVGYLTLGASEFEKRTYRGYAQQAAEIIGVRLARNN